RYIALSHCWGEQPLLTTTVDNLSERKGGIQWELLPLTFQHAIQICAGLGVEYLWIDSLCILQGNEDDWARESEKMASIYANSWLTIAAAAARDSSYGCLPKGNAFKTYFLPAKSPDGAPRRRAWVFQERILAKRVLYMCEDEMMFECFANIRCECSDIDTDWSMYSTGWSVFLPFRPTGILETWDYLVHHYARRKITYHRDRLPGFAGIAKKISGTRAMGRYCAGLWEYRLEECMLWYILPTTEDVVPLPPIRKSDSAPSWSWASVNG
ncbi:HET-domain-containing protein, partial [Paraphaeosphaeria sporulosa]